MCFTRSRFGLRRRSVQFAAPRISFAGKNKCRLRGITFARRHRRVNEPELGPRTPEPHTSRRPASPVRCIALRPRTAPPWGRVAVPGLWGVDGKGPRSEQAAPPRAVPQRPADGRRHTWQASGQRPRQVLKNFLVLSVAGCSVHLPVSTAHVDFRVKRTDRDLGVVLREPFLLLVVKSLRTARQVDVRSDGGTGRRVRLVPGGV